jgi:flavin-binding protein dodecin
MSVAKIVEIVGSSNKSWDDAAQNAVNEAVKTIPEIHGIEIKDMTATMNQSTGKITQYRTAVKLSFGVEHSKYLKQ